MLFKGTKRRTAFKIVQEVDIVSDILNGFTEKEATIYYCTLPKDYIGLALDILTDIVFNSILTSNTLFSDTLLWTVYTCTTPGQVTDIVSALNDEFYRLRK